MFMFMFWLRELCIFAVHQWSAHISRRTAARRKEGIPDCVRNTHGARDVETYLFTVLNIKKNHGYK